MKRMEGLIVEKIILTCLPPNVEAVLGPLWRTMYQLSVCSGMPIVLYAGIADNHFKVAPFSIMRDYRIARRIIMQREDLCVLVVTNLLLEDASLPCSRNFIQSISSVLSV